uniref:Bridging integrator 3 n=1 Tax=Sphaerodactylus townsendi TaxID=933632 RepID=A0ACB8EX92_9SAUR
MAVKRREQTLQDYKRLQSKVEKYEEKDKTGPILAKLHQAREELRPVKEDFEAKNKQLLEEMPKFYSSRIDYFKPSFESLIRAQDKKAKALYKKGVWEDAAVIHSFQLTQLHASLPYLDQLWGLMTCFPTDWEVATVVYYTEMYKIFGDLTEQLDEPGPTDEEREKENEAKLNELRALSIVADD